ncbi:alcohol oxidase [Exidia glandulosa HHB12029]|uniref:Alcohol oxidase n=1 Tax=Exidia glandulosa HHB12029 TaxID=1314781 RepID=A0A165DMP9_EXIGL|nr:alcohol oxidase [Exidia glandulosa HHB12029]
MARGRVAGAFAQLLALSSVCFAYADIVSELSAREISASEAKSSYDFIVVGGGQAGLVIANRLTEDPHKSVLLVEYGYISTDPAQEDPSSAKGLNNQLNATVYAAAVLGGGSTGMMLDRGAPDDYDNWEKLGNKGWGWSDLLPYFKKATHLVPPVPSIANEFNVTWDLSAYGPKNTPIELSFPTFMYPGTKNQYKGMIEAGVTPQKEGALHAYGLFWYPGALTAKEVKRSYAVSGYYRPISSRKNLHLLTGTRVNEILFSKSKRATGVTIQARGTPDGENVQVIKAHKEIVLTAGFLHTPHILQRSGVGPAALLRAANIPVVVDLPGVGHNLQDHAAGLPAFQFNTDVTPNPDSLTNNATFQAWADELWAANRTGPRSIGVGNVGAWIPLPVLTPEYKSIVSTIRSQDITEYLPSSYDRDLLAGHKKQRELIAASYTKTTSGAIELPFGGSPAFSLSLEHPLSRGTVMLDPTNKYAEPIVDYHSLSNPVDALVLAKSVQFGRKWMSTPAMRELSPTEVAPGAALQSDEELINAVRGGSIASTAHGCCTAALSPRNQGGVVSPDLLVYGVKGLSVGDVSTIPLITGAHTCATVYAIAEKAADLIKARH